jgi:hypothetical protein
VARKGEKRNSDRHFVRKSEGKMYLEDHGLNEIILLKWVLKMKWLGLDSFGAEFRQAAGFYKEGNDHSTHIKYRKLLDELKYYKLLMKGSGPQSHLLCRNNKHLSTTFVCRWRVFDRQCAV